MADAKEQKSEPEAAGGGGGSSKVMMGVLGLNTVVMIAVAIVLFLGQKKQASQETLGQVQAGAEAAHGGGHAPAPAAGGHGGGHGEPAGADPAAGPQARFFPVGDFTSNLAGPASTSYVKVSVNFEISQDADEEEMKQRKPQFRDKIISLLNSKRAVDLQSADGVNYLKEEIKTTSNTFIKKGKVEGVYFSAFVIN